MCLSLLIFAKKYKRKKSDIAKNNFILIPGGPDLKNINFIILNYCK